MTIFCANEYRTGRQSSRRDEDATEAYHDLGVISSHLNVLSRVRSIGPINLTSLAGISLTIFRYLDAWKAGDYTSAFDNLHRYFDYTMHSNLDRSAYQFALLNLAIIQADFECFSEAISAVQEAVAIARESHDMNCLNFCMSWLYHFGKAFPEQMREVQNSGMLGNEKEGLAFLKAKSKETDMWSLLSTTLVSEAKLEMQQVCLESFFIHGLKKSC